MKSKEIKKCLIDKEIRQKELATEMGILPASLNRALRNEDVCFRTGLKIAHAIESIEQRRALQKKMIDARA